MKYLISFVACMLIIISTNVANSAPNGPQKFSSEEIKELMLKHTGGDITKPSEGATIHILNMQKKIAEHDVQLVTDEINRVLGIPFVIEDSKGESAKMARNRLQKKEVGAVMVIVANDDSPTILLAPEEPWVQLNVAPLMKGSTNDIIKSRLQKEIWRSFAFLMGAANSTSEKCALQPVFSLNDLDALKYNVVSPEPFNGIMKQAQKLGIKPMRKTTYRQAVIEGWAPQPQDQYQQAIWDELKKK